MAGPESEVGKSMAGQGQTREETKCATRDWHGGQGAQQVQRDVSRALRHAPESRWRRTRDAPRPDTREP